MKSHVEASVECSGCGACVDICPKEAISLCFDSKAVLYPTVDLDRCVECGACKTVCMCGQTNNYPEAKEAFIAVCRNGQLYERSSSGGIFAIAAWAVLTHGGVVYGAAFVPDKNGIDCRITKVDRIEKLNRIQGSKYVHSRTDGVFKEIRTLLENNTPVLFSGTSCQVAALKLFLCKEYTNLFTVDLVCHGVPEISQLQTYLKYLEAKYRTKIRDISFRSKKAVADKKSGDSYVLTLSCLDQNTAAETTKLIPKYLSSYFTLFLSRANYRPNCYVCKYASIKKPGDITLGDFKPSLSEYNQLGLDKELTYSSVFIRTVQGVRLIHLIQEYCDLVEIPLADILRHHKNLRQASKITSAGKRYRMIYKLLGPAGLDNYLIIKSRLRLRKN